MATTGSVYVDITFKDPARGGVIVSAGRLLVGQNATIDARDFQMRTLKAVTATPWFSAPMTAGTQNQARSALMVSGSIGSLDTLNNYLRVQSYRLRTAKATGGAAYPGTVLLGTQAGSFRLSYFAVGR